MSISKVLLRFAKAREKAYKVKGELDGARAKAVTQIKFMAGYISGYHPLKQLRFIPQIEEHILAIMPSEESPFKEQREKMQSLLERAKS